MKNKFINFILLLSILTMGNIAQGEIITTYSINSSTIEDINKWIDQDTVVFIELDDVLVMPKSKMFYYNDNPYRSFIQDVINLSSTNSKYLLPVAKWYQTRKLKLVEEGWKNFIDNLKKRNIPVYGFCSMPVYLQNIEKHRILELENLGIIFTSNVNNQEIIQLNKQGEWPSFFYHGIIFTGPFNKSVSLLDFIKITNISPKKIVFLDKDKYQLQFIDRTLRNFRMDFYNILYLGARNFKAKTDDRIVQLQQKTLLEQRKWLEDEEAEALIKDSAHNTVQ